MEKWSGVTPVDFPPGENPLAPQIGLDEYLSRFVSSVQFILMIVIFWIVSCKNSILTRLKYGFSKSKTLFRDGTSEPCISELEWESQALAKESR